MTGPEHFREAERIAKILSTGKASNRRLTADEIARYHAAGELHSRLALVTMLATAIADDVVGDMGESDRAWFTALREA
jgi:hypothetical protein